MYYSLLVVYPILCSLSIHSCGACPSGADIVPGNQWFENKPSSWEKFELSNYHAGSVATSPRSRAKENNYLKPMTISEDNRQSLMLEKQTQVNHRAGIESTHGDSNENIKPKEAKSVHGEVEVMDYAQPRQKPPIHNQEQ